jgi:WD40 repeat protein
VRSAAFSSASGLVVTGGGDGTVRFWDLTTGVERLRIALFEDGDWVSQTPDGTFDASENGLAYLALYRDGAFASDEELEQRFRDPEAVVAAVSGGTPADPKLR